tara:strand:- start:4920 stop:5492 length:573 start_codon:yes stop_codon:yes gene_type:complete
MQIRKIVGIFFFILLLLVIAIYLYSNFLKKKKIEKTSEISDELLYSSNVIKNVKYQSTDANGNKYYITALTGEVDYSNPNIIYLTDVESLIILEDSEKITITSDYGKYDSSNFNTIFSKNVIIKYLDNKITGEYLDFSVNRNTMIISQNVIYTNLENILRADVMEMNIKTKDTKIFMYEKEKKVNIKNRY